MPYKIAILASGSGTNAENIARYFAQSDVAVVDVVLADRREAGVAARMQPLGIPTFYVPGSVWKADPAKIVEFLHRRNIDIVVLAGFLRYVAPEILRAFPGRVVNIHPSLLPKFGGKGMWGHKVHEAVIEAGETKSGPTVHFVSEVMDGGDILMQQEVPVLPDDTPETLETRVHEAEYELYPRAIEKLIAGLPGGGATGTDIPDKDNTEAAEPQSESGSESAAVSPAVESPESQWAKTLGVNYVAPAEGGASVPPPVPVPPPVEGDAFQAPPAVNSESVYSPAREELRMPDAYLVWCIIFIVFCCAPAAIVALIYSLKVSSRWYDGDYEGARHASDIVQRWLIASFAIGVIEATFFIPVWLFSGL